MVLEFLIHSSVFQFLSVLYWGLAVFGWLELAAAGSMTWPAFRMSLSVIGGLYIGAVAVVALVAEAFV